jgi:hypothetical protein
VFISDDNGANWYQGLSFNNGPSSYRNDVIDIDAAAAANGLTLNDHFQIKFQFYDNYPITSDGYAIDEVQLLCSGEIPPFERVYLPIVLKSYPPSSSCSDTQVIQNGGFESGNTIWVQQSGSYTIIGQQYPYSGSWNAWFGGYDYASDKLYQTINIPSDISSARLTLYLYVYTSDSLSTPYDYFHVELQDSSGNTLQSFLEADNTMHSSSWYKGTMSWSDFSAHAGATRRLFFQGSTDSSNYTNFFVDDVTLWTYCGSLPSGAGAEGSSDWTWKRIDAPPGGLMPLGAMGGKER